MRFFRLIRFYFELSKAVFRIVLYLSKKCRKLLVCVLIAIILIYLLFGFLMALMATVFGFLYIIYSFCDYLLYNPNDPIDSRTNVLSPMAFNLSFESHFITTEDNININVLLIKRPENEYKLCPTIIYLHGNAGNIGHRLQNCYEIYHEICCNILLVEYRGYGLSGGFPSERGLYLDASAALDYLIGRPDIDSNKIVVFGRSLGGAVAIDLVKNGKNQTKIGALIIENTFTSIPEIARTLFNCRFIRQIPNWFYKNQFNSVSKMSSITVPTLFLSGVNDELIPSTMMTTLYMLCSSVNKQLHRLDGGTHNFTWKCQNYYNIIRVFLGQLFQQNAPNYAEVSVPQSVPSTSTTSSPLLLNQSLITFNDIDIQTLRSNKTINI